MKHRAQFAASVMSSPLRTRILYLQSGYTLRIDQDNLGPRGLIQKPVLMGPLSYMSRESLVEFILIEEEVNLNVWFNSRNHSTATPLWSIYYLGIRILEYKADFKLVHFHKLLKNVLNSLEEYEAMVTNYQFPKVGKHKIKCRLETILSACS
ncbi:hypothetical protein TorRG33x02_001720 [Trema orientale]|uniref:Uncharacterized protein n=1 Tax=Trema orientale TaxID=63057 RepID=A0A2P5G1D1_TREOI|nr:hypothetical protein TorRG33x02_001720 [Trema orientale]